MDKKKLRSERTNAMIIILCKHQTLLIIILLIMYRLVTKNSHSKLPKQIQPQRHVICLKNTYISSTN